MQYPDYKECRAPICALPCLPGMQVTSLGTTFSITQEAFKTMGFAEQVFNSVPLKEALEFLKKVAEDLVPHV